MKFPKIPVAATALAVAWATIFVSTSSATIISGAVTGGNAGGSFVKLFDPIGNVGSDNHQSPNLFGFDEEQNVFLASNLAVDLLAGGGSGTLAAGQVVASHYVFFDPAINSNIEGTVTFDSDIVAIITSRNNLDASDALVNLTANYLSPTLRGLEAADSVSITGARTIFVDFQANSPGDYIRVLTQFSPAAALPEPGTLAIVGFSLFCIGWMYRRRPRSIPAD
jgi:hypothetical protein